MFSLSIALTMVALHANPASDAALKPAEPPPTV